MLLRYETAYFDVFLQPVTRPATASLLALLFAITAVRAATFLATAVVNARRGLATSATRLDTSHVTAPLPPLMIMVLSATSAASLATSLATALPKVVSRAPAVATTTTLTRVRLASPAAATATCPVTALKAPSATTAVTLATFLANVLRSARRRPVTNVARLAISRATAPSRLKFSPDFFMPYLLGLPSVASWKKVL
ncbi:hypothetical protein BCR41DRAFT_245474 [Lobosporangium transversale]|uniref:Uncharacterized protein n=1 Tax=Lobosporangium transversale TaxID=64571 RepID=A0A1Y2GU14_9FUNG|nr:hypothetical protein BCR41DRAFT_245474 [Lobosporangium transversale]ORZ23747.1 hypothetical protein BCR41DRAFT_245474 [Lobosporangium transversale]|eukprot:XP_021883561.1 hypothetical protein BCR41DRAFT_245474 [Lobosporangium transversale]